MVVEMVADAKCLIGTRIVCCWIWWWYCMIMLLFCILESRIIRTMSLHAAALLDYQIPERNRDAEGVEERGREFRVFKDDISTFH